MPCLVNVVCRVGHHTLISWGVKSSHSALLLLMSRVLSSQSHYYVACRVCHHYPTGGAVRGHAVELWLAKPIIGTCTNVRTLIDRLPTHLPTCHLSAWIERAHPPHVN